MKALERLPQKPKITLMHITQQSYTCWKQKLSPWIF